MLARNRETRVAIRRARKASRSTPGSAALQKRLRAAERRLRDVERRYDLVMGAVNEGVYDWDIGRGSVYYSVRVHEYLGLPPETLRDANDWLARIHPDDLARYRAAHVAHFKGQTARFECDYRYRDGKDRWRWARTHGLAMRDRRGRAVRMVGSTGDITELKSAELELRRARDEAHEALEQQKASAEVLGAVSSSIADTAPVFDKILESCQRLFAGTIVGLNLVREDGRLHIGAYHGEHREAFERIFPIPLSSDSGSAIAIRERRVTHYPDATAADVPAPTRRGCEAIGVRSVIFAPVLWQGRGLGSIFVGRDRASTFSDKEIALLRTFADQAAIAIQNARLFRETREALEQQTATGDILASISGSITDTRPVFEAIVEKVQRLFGTRFVGLFLRNGERIELAAYSKEPGFAGIVASYPRPLDDETIVGQAMLKGEVLQVAPIIGNPRSPPRTEKYGRDFGYDSIIAAPLLRDGAVIGGIGAARREPVPFTDKQVALIRTFADQAVIAIQNARLFNETKEALGQQTATAEILRVMAASQTDVQPVFDAIAQHAVRLCGALSGIVFRYDGELLHVAAHCNLSEETLRVVQKVFPYPPDERTVSGRAVMTRSVQRVEDVHADTESVAAFGKSAGFRRTLSVPMLREGRAVGAISVTWPESGPIADSQVALLSTFADQAVIAIENVRLFREIEDKSRQLEVASRHKSEFLANMSHELRTPLNAIIGFTRIVMRRTQEQIEPRQYENLEKILVSAQNLLGLINAVLDLSKVEAGRVEVVPAETPLEPVLEQCLRTVEPLVRSDAVVLKREFDSVLPSLYVDEEKLRQIVINLLSNAAKFTEHGSIRLSARAGNGSIDIAVADTGIGIAPAKIEKIFEEFEQADARSTRVHGGTGLGLTIARRLARLMGGDIHAESEPGSGSTFTLTLPLHYEARA